jgi:exopolyphosphatase/pppGpp-phosphohydrolase
LSGRQRIGASVDLGSNSVHLLVAAIAGHRLRPLIDESAFLGLGAAVDERAHLGTIARAELVTTLQRYVSTAHLVGATTVTLMGTEPIRRAADNARIVADVEAGTGVALHVLSHEEEAFLTLIGVTEGRPVTHQTLVVDIGGGSSEFCAVGSRGQARAAGLRLGSDRLTNRHVTADPPTLADVAAMTTAADLALADAMDGHPREIVVVGGTASNLLKVAPGGVPDPILTRDRLAAALTTLLSQPAFETSERYGVNLKRARLLPAGAAIVDALLRRYGATHARVSDAGMREGAILIADHVGRSWRDRLESLAHGWRTA